MDQAERKRMMDHVYAALVEQGYRPTDQIIGYILTGDPTYITNHNRARCLIAGVGRHDLLRDVLSAYFSAEGIDANGMQRDCLRAPRTCI